MSGSAMFTAVTGAVAQQVRIDTIANNLANLNTNGFKRIRAHFEDLLYETVQVPSEEGGTPNGLQFGRGTRVVATEHVHSPGAVRQTGQNFDLAIEGEGFFAIQKLNGDTAYSRNGSFRLNSSGTLVNAAGLQLQPPITIPSDATEVNINADGTVNVLQSGSSSVTQVGQIQLNTFINPGGLMAVGHNLFVETDASGSPTSGNPGSGSIGAIQQGALEQSNVNIAEELVNLIQAQRAFEANTRIISTADDLLRFVTQR
jgi:flagellar basal-body rod protein FlgG